MNIRFMINQMVAKMSKKVIVIGAGAAGTMAAGVAGENGADVLLLERNEKIARKVMIIVITGQAVLITGFLMPSV